MWYACRRQRRVCSEPDRELGGALTKRAGGGWHACAEDRGRAPHPPAQRRPLLGRGEPARARRARRRSCPLRVGPGIAPERERIRDAREGVPEAATDAARDDHEDCAARGAQEAATLDLAVHRIPAGLERALDHASEQPVPDERQRLARLAARNATSGAARGPHRAARRRGAGPGLDADLGMDDSYGASRGLTQRSSSRSRREHGASTPPATSSPGITPVLGSGAALYGGRAALARNMHAPRWRAGSTTSRSLREIPAGALSHSAR